MNIYVFERVYYELKEVKLLKFFFFSGSQIFITHISPFSQTTKQTHHRSTELDPSSIDRYIYYYDTDTLHHAEEEDCKGLGQTRCFGTYRASSYFGRRPGEQ